MDTIPTPTIGEILKEAFMETFGLSAYRVAKEISVPTSRIQDILHNRRQITVDTSIRLSRLFGIFDRYFLNSQNDIDIRNAEINENSQDFDQIKPIAIS